MILSRLKAATKSNKAKNEEKKSTITELEHLLSARDYTGALTLVQFWKNNGKRSIENDLWCAFCSFHLADYKSAKEIYEKLAKGKCEGQVWLNLSCCYFMLGMTKEAEQAALKGPKNPLQTRLLFHIYYKMGEDAKMMQSHNQLKDTIEDQLCLASGHYLRGSYQEAVEVYKQILSKHSEYLALNVYMALCYYKLDCYDLSQDVLNSYLLVNEDSSTAMNLKACNQFKLYSGKVAEIELKSLQEMCSASFTYAQDLIKHNLSVFRNGQGALQVLPQQLHIIPEARINLVIYHLRQDELSEAHDLIVDLEPSSLQEYTIKGVVFASVGQERNSKEHLDKAEQMFKVVGTSKAECDTITGRTCMASAFFLKKQFEEVLIYFNSIKNHYYNDDIFNYNYGQAKAALRHYKEAEEAFLLIQSESLKSDPNYLCWLAKCFIMNRKPRLAWELYLKMETSTDSYNLLLIIASDCYKMGLFFYSAKAYDVLERLDSSPEYWEGERGACVGAFQLIISGQEPKESIRDLIQMLEASDNEEVKYISKIMKRWAKENKVDFY